MKKTSKTNYCNCDYCVWKRAAVDKRLKNSLSNINKQFEESRKKNKEFEKTTKLLRLLGKEKEYHFS